MLYSSKNIIDYVLVNYVLCCNALLSFCESENESFE